MIAATVALPGAASGIRRGSSLANSAGTDEFSREDPATSLAALTRGKAGHANH